MIISNDVVNDVVNDEGELVQHSLYVDTKPDNVTKSLKDSKWMHAMT